MHVLLSRTLRMLDYSRQSKIILYFRKPMTLFLPQACVGNPISKIWAASITCEHRLFFPMCGNLFLTALY
jgi:hypothetical protein